MTSTFYILLVFSAYRPHLMGLNIVSDHIWHSEAGGAIGIDQQTFVFKLSVDEKCCERRLLYLLERVTQQSTPIGSTVTSMASKIRATHVEIFYLDNVLYTL